MLIEDYLRNCDTRFSDNLGSQVANRCLEWDLQKAKRREEFLVHRPARPYDACNDGRRCVNITSLNLKSIVVFDPIDSKTEDAKPGE